jgi:tRNA (guanine-N7-)-methyltransferase
MQALEEKEKRYTLFGRRKGRRLREGKAELMQTLLPRLTIDARDPLKLLQKFSEIWLEIGFGGGEHLAYHAKHNPHIGFIGCEPFVNGVASLLDHLNADHINNVFIQPDDARLVLDHLPGASINRCFVLFPDPWPKKRHAPRRFIGRENLKLLGRVMKQGAELRVASDDPTLQDWMIAHLRASEFFQANPKTENGLFKQRPEDWPETRYEKKALAKKRLLWRGAEYYSFIRK